MSTMRVEVAILWRAVPKEVRIEIEHGTLLGGTVPGGAGRFADGAFALDETGPGRVEVAVDTDSAAPGAGAATGSVRTEAVTFTFFLRDVRAEYPIVIPGYGVAVTVAGDARSFDGILRAVRDRGLLTRREQIDREQEESFEDAAAHTRTLRSPTWLGVSRDVRIFEVGLRQPMLYTDWIQPRFHGHGYFRDESLGLSGVDREYIPPRYGFVAGRGWACAEEVRRRLDEGVLPILIIERIDDDVRYETTAFATLERTPLTAAGVRGTHYLVADGLSMCHAFTQEQKKQHDALREGELNRDEETVLVCRVVAVNTGDVPRYAFFKAPHPHLSYGNPEPHRFDGARGLGFREESDLVFGISRLDGQPMPQEEIAVLLAPGAESVMEFFLPHGPIPQDRAEALGRRDPEECLEQCRRFWRGKLAAAAEISLPEKRIDEMVRAGLLHLDLVSYGLEPDGTLNMSNGAYSALGSETIRNILFFDSMGLHDLARRGLDFFLEKQHENGSMQNFSNFKLETGAVLWCLCEHYRHTRDEAWRERIRPCVRKACEFLVNWRRECRTDGRHGLLSGNVADPQDQEPIFMLNGYAYLGLSRASELLAGGDDAEAERLRAEADALRQDIRAALFEELGLGPVVPLGDGTWCPTVGPWAGHHGPVCLFADGKNWWTHGAMTIRDDILGPLHLVFQEVLDLDEQATTFLFDYHGELLYSRNVSFSEPYYSIHPWLHLRRRETKPFLKAYYNTVAAMADRETYSFWEHFYHESIHKTAEEAQFLLQTRWMLYLEEGEGLALLRGIPRAWLEDGKSIRLRDIASHFGRLSLRVDSKLSEGLIAAEITCDSGHGPEWVTIRLPHPRGQRAAQAEGGVYDPESETVRFRDFPGHAQVRLRFARCGTSPDRGTSSG